MTAATASVYCEQTLMFVCAKGQKYKFTLGTQGGATGSFAGPVWEFAL